MKHIDELSQIKEWLPYLALVSIASYACSITFQLGYFAAFSVDLFIINPRIDPTSLFTLTVVIAVATIGIIEISLLNWFKKYRSFKAAVAVDMLFVTVIGLAYAAYLINMSEINSNVAEQGGPPAYLIHVLPLLIFLLFTIRFIGLFRMMKSEKIDFSEAYIATSLFLALDKGKIQSKKPRKAMQWAMYAVIASLIFIIIPATVGNSFAKDRSSFTEIIDDDMPVSSKKLVIIGATANGYIAKTFDIEKNEYSVGWQIINKDNLKLQHIKVTTLNDQSRY